MTTRRNKEEFQQFWDTHFLLRDTDPKLFQKLLEDKFGKRPYEFLQPGEGIPSRLADSKKPLIIESPIYRLQHPAPNSFNFKDEEYLDLEGRKYKIGTGEFAKIQQDLTGINKSFIEPQGEVDTNVGKVLLWVCLPRDSIIKPPIVNTFIELLHLKTNILCMGTIEESHFVYRNITGYILMKDFVVLGAQSKYIDNSTFNHVRDKRSLYYKRIKK